VVTVSDIGTLVLIFAPKIYLVHKEGEAGMLVAGEQLREYAAKRWERGRESARGGKSKERSTADERGTGDGVVALSIKTQTGGSLADMDPAPGTDGTYLYSESEPDDQLEASEASSSASPRGIPVLHHPPPPPPQPAMAPPLVALAKGLETQPQPASQTAGSARSTTSARANKVPAARSTAVPASQSILYGTHRPLAPRPATADDRGGGFWGRRAAPAGRSTDA